ncbi:hypothetical protein [Streptomyces fungicidicus]|uniref:Uncharacterized protein n=1 Tax=Streptomyces fungicidicus TaxID=68203 RepID=A0ACC7XWW7_9ACTN|nr:hypothetical protein [Streptomyces fungicidicus]NUV74116.1 hypothetical protein [Streptomyces fungicidicus]
MLATLLAVAGTLLGALVSGLLQHHLARAARAESQAVRDAATTAITATYAIRDATDPTHLDALRQAALTTHDHLVEEAARHLTP